MQRAARETPHALRLRNIPKSATRNDVARMLMRAQVEGVTSVELEYNRWLPAGSALIQFHRPEYVPASSHRLKGRAIQGIPVIPENLSRFALQDYQEALKKQEKNTGTGPSANTTHLEEKVVLWGFTPRWNATDVAALLRSYRLHNHDVDGGANSIWYTPLADQTHSRKFVARMAGPEEAHRVVRDLHMTPVPHLFGVSPSIGQYLRARVLSP
ncbi:hypothetical protein GGF50DRAFT_96693 [Schizophyllum commune]